jgi:protein phosphatase PTC7
LAIDNVHKFVREGDIVIAGSDGIFDNLFVPQIKLILENCLAQGFSVQKTAERIAKTAYTLSLDFNYRSPFYKEALRAGYYIKGGKSDDISVIVS